MRPIVRKSGYGFSLIEVLIAVVVLSVGLLALAALQARLARSGAESKIQTVALSLAQERVEQLRNFGSRDQYRQIDSSAAEVINRQGAGGAFTRNVTVTRWVWNTTTQSFVQAASNTDTVGPREFKEIGVSVGWTDADGQGRSVVLRDTVSATAPADSALTLRDNELVKRQPRVHIYTPSEVGIIPIAIGTDLAAASSNPQPELSKRGTSTVTQFNVQTYRTDSSNPLLQRRVDFAFTNCDCQMAGVSSNTSPAFEPTYWNGMRYTPPKRIPDGPGDTRSRPIGESVTRFMNGEDFQDQLCDSCCRDHHDPVTAETKVDPFRPRNDVTPNNHNHYELGFATGDAPITGNQTYHEVCRLVRVDGIFRVATDTRMENLTLLRMSGSPSSPTLAKPTIDAYASFAKDFVAAAWVNYVSTLPATDEEPRNQFPGPDLLLESCTGAPLTCTPTTLGQTHNGTVLNLRGTGMAPLEVTNTEPKWLNARGLYIDWISQETKDAIACIGNTTEARCRTFRDATVLELVPFVAVNMTGLSRFGPTSSSIVAVLNQAISNTGYLRGRVSARSSGIEPDVFALSSGGNAGLVDRSPASPAESSRQLRDSEVGVISTTTATAPPLFRIRAVTSEARNGFTGDQLQVKIFAPEVIEPRCSPGARNTTRDLYACEYTATAAQVDIDLANYNMCPAGFEWNGSTCTQTNRKGVTTTSSLLDFKFCSVRGLGAGMTALNHANAAVTALGTPKESTRVVIRRDTALATELSELAGLEAVFVRQMTNCP
jgi:type IV pilus modification protein PilV